MTRNSNLQLRSLKGVAAPVGCQTRSLSTSQDRMVSLSSRVKWRLGNGGGDLIEFIEKARVLGAEPRKLFEELVD